MLTNFSILFLTVVGFSVVSAQSCTGACATFHMNQQGGAGSCPYAKHHMHELRAGPVTTKTVSTTTTYYGGQTKLTGARFDSYPLNQNEIQSIQHTWQIAKKIGSIAPKIFIRYFQAKPESQSLFPAFATVPLKDLRNNSDFLLQAYTCVTALNNYIKYLGENVESCPYISQLKFKFTADDLKTLNEIIFAVLVEELDNRFTTEARSVWQKAIRACDVAVRKNAVLSDSGTFTRSPFTERQKTLLLTSWKEVQQIGNIAPKTFIKYFEMKPEAQKLFPAFSNVSRRDLPTNYAFLAAVNTCFSNLHYLIEKIGRNPLDCPVFSKVVGKYNAEDAKVRFAWLFLHSFMRSMI